MALSFQDIKKNLEEESSLQIENNYNFKELQSPANRVSTKQTLPSLMY